MVRPPLPEALRPRDLKDFVGQEHLVGSQGLLKKLLDSPPSNFFPSLILWGPPGSGKTTLGRIIAHQLQKPFYEFSAVNASIKDIERVMVRNRKTAKESQLKLVGLKTEESLAAIVPLVLIDEIHRFNKSQQAALLPHVERGTVILIGATTENPSFEVVGPLLSRCRVLILSQLTEKELETIVNRGLVHLQSQISPEAKRCLIEFSNGDARVALNTLEIAKNLNPKSQLTIADIKQALQKEPLLFDKRGEEYYNVISAYIKSLRASDVNAALYYLARMVEAGQDPLYIARRMVIFASEDIGMAAPTALVVANEVFRACETIGYPECTLNLAHGTVYLALTKKDRSSTAGYFAALSDVKKYGNLAVPLKIRNPVTKLMKEIGYGKGYKKYKNQSLLPDKLKGKKYLPTSFSFYPSS